jgi:murein DD-endopeptidase MepM/ murein hydrolase activator NlpD
MLVVLFLMGVFTPVMANKVSPIISEPSTNQTIAINPTNSCPLASNSSYIPADADYMKDLFDNQKPFSLRASKSDLAITLGVKNNGQFDLRKYHPKHKNQLFVAKRDPSCYNAITLTHVESGSVVSSNSQSANKFWKNSKQFDQDNSYLVDYNPLSKSITLRSRQTYSQGLMSASSGYLPATFSEIRTLFDQEFDVVPNSPFYEPDSPATPNKDKFDFGGEVFRIPFSTKAKVEVSQGPFGEFSHRYPAMDFAAPSGTPVLASKSGKVIRANYLDGIGNNVVIDHGGKKFTKYGHLSEIKVTVGSFVEQGKVIGNVGSTGNSTGPHLHFEYHTKSSSNPTMLKFAEFDMEKFRGRSDYARVKGTMTAK